MRTKTDVELIIDYLLDDTGELKLNKRLQDKFSLLNKMDNWKCGEDKSDRDIILLLTKPEYGYSESTAYVMLREMRLVFVTVKGSDKKYMLQRAFEKNEQNQQLAKDAGDLKALALFEKNFVEMCKQIEAESNIPKFDLNNIPITILKFDPRALGIEPIPIEDLERLFIEFNTPKKIGFAPSSFEDISHEDVL